MNNTNEQKVLKEIFSKPTYKFHIRELAKLTKLNPNTIINITQRLIKQGIIRQEKKKHLTEIYLNFEDKKVLIKKRIFNLSQLYESGLIEFLSEKYESEAIAVIGSYSRGEDIEKSDIDIVVISKKKELIGLEFYEKALNRKIHLLPLNYKEMSEEFYTNLINGFILQGYITKK